MRKLLILIALIVLLCAALVLPAAAQSAIPAPLVPTLAPTEAAPPIVINNPPADTSSGSNLYLLVGLSVLLNVVVLIVIPFVVFWRTHPNATPAQFDNALVTDVNKLGSNPTFIKDAQTLYQTLPAGFHLFIDGTDGALHFIAPSTAFKTDDVLATLLDTIRQTNAVPPASPPIPDPAPTPATP